MTFKVQLEPSGHSFDVQEGESLLEAALRANIGLPYGCRSGRCGACAAKLCEGEVHYPEGEPPAMGGLSAEMCLPCMAHAVSDLTLQVREAESVAEIQVRTLPCRVVRVDHLCHDVIRLYLKLPEGQRLQFQAGQYLEFLLSDGRRRAFSIANAPHDDEFIELHIRHVDGGQFTDWVFSQLKEKSILRIEAPLGSFVLDEQSDRPMLFMAGGTGFAPVKGQIEHAFHTGIDRPMVLYWGVRSKRDLYMTALPEQWAAEHENFSFVPVLSEPDADWTGRSGWVHEALLADHPDLSGFDIYMAGPPAMVHAARDAFREVGAMDEHMFSDAFEFAKDK
jgi:CDP-4-dehydro-6-deoxyglucose reductase